MTDIPVLIDLDEPTGVATVTLNRPAIHNAFDDTMIAELTKVLSFVGGHQAVHVVVLAANGKSFSAGGDLGWMKRMAAYTDAENLEDARGLAGMLHTLDTLPKPTIARVQGPAYGGGVGLIAACDIAIGADSAVFSLSEVRLGLIASAISPYVVAAIGARWARRYLLTAERFDAAAAQGCGLLHEVCTAAALDGAVQKVVALLLEGGPVAQAESKDLIRRVRTGPVDAAMREDTAGRIARLRASPEGREGVGAFLEKRKPGWRK